MVMFVSERDGSWFGLGLVEPSCRWVMVAERVDGFVDRVLLIRGDAQNDWLACMPNSLRHT